MFARHFIIPFFYHGVYLARRGADFPPACPLSVRVCACARSKLKAGGAMFCDLDIGSSVAGDGEGRGEFSVRSWL